MTVGSFHNSDHLAKKPGRSTLSSVAWVRWRARSRICNAAATTLHGRRLPSKFAPSGGVCGAGAGLLLVLPWGVSTVGCQQGRRRPRPIGPTGRGPQFALPGWEAEPEGRAALKGDAVISCFFTADGGAVAGTIYKDFAPAPLPRQCRAIVKHRGFLRVSPQGVIAFSTLGTPGRTCAGQKTYQASVRPPSAPPCEGPKLV